MNKESVKNFLKKVLHFIKNNGIIFSIIFSFLAFGLGSFNTYLILNSGGVVSPNGDVVKYPSPEKILKELPADAPVMGNPNAKITMVEFADYQCPFCGKFNSEVFPELERNYINNGKIKLVYLDFAFLGEESKDAARAVRCSKEQGKFWEYHDELYKNQQGENMGAFNTVNLKIFAKNIGLDIEKFNTCIVSTKYDKQIQAEKDLGLKYGVSGTPSFIIGNKLLKGGSNITFLKQIIDNQP